MAEVKWIKFVVGTFDGSSFKKIKRAKLKDGSSYRDKLTAVWFELLDLAGKRNNNGVLANVDELELGFSSESQFEDIATMLDRPTEEVECCIQWFIQNHMIEITDDLYQLTNWSKYQSADKLDTIRENARLRQQKHRQKIGMSRDSNVTSNVTVTLCHAPRIKNIEREEDIDIDKSIVEIDNEKKTNLDQIDKLFNTFWTTYPRKDGKKKCLQWFEAKSHNVTGELVDTMVKAIEKNIKYNPTWKNKQYIPMPLTWLNGERWNDEIDVPSETTSKQPRLLEEI